MVSTLILKLKTTIGKPTWKTSSEIAPGSTLQVARRADPAYLADLAEQLAKGTSIVKILHRSRGFPVDFTFVVKDRESGYKDAAPIVRRITTESLLPVDFHFATEDQI